MLAPTGTFFTAVGHVVPEGGGGTPGLGEALGPLWTIVQCALAPIRVPRGALQKEHRIEDKHISNRDTL